MVLLYMYYLCIICVCTYPIYVCIYTCVSLFLISIYLNLYVQRSKYQPNSKPCNKNL